VGPEPVQIASEPYVDRLRVPAPSFLPDDMEVNVSWGG
jgi:hypothetical protein